MLEISDLIVLEKSIGTQPRMISQQDTDVLASTVKIYLKELYDRLTLQDTVQEAGDFAFDTTDEFKRGWDEKLGIRSSL